MFINEQRIARASRLLMEGEVNITEIAFACGFGNLSNFNRQFLRAKRVSPRQYRSRMMARTRRSKVYQGF